MKQTLRLLSALLLAPLAALPAASSETNLFERGAILRLMHCVNDWQVTHPVMKTNSRTWIRGTWFTGVMAAYRTTGDERFLQQAVGWGRQHDWQVGNEQSGANKLFCVETWAGLYFVRRDPAMIAPSVAWLDSAASNTPTGAKVWYLEGGRRYADSLYGASALAMLAKATGERKYLGWMNDFFWDVHAEIFDKEAGLLYRDKRFINQTTKNGKKVFWSRGNGWVVGGIVRILEYLPEDHPMRGRYVELLHSMAAAIATRQGADGLWRSNLDDPDDFPVPETSGSGFFCYGIAWGINHGVLDREKFLPVAQKAWAGLVMCLADDGKIQWGQLVGDRPAAVQQADTHEYVTGTFLLAASEMYRLAPRKNGKD